MRLYENLQSVSTDSVDTNEEVSDLFSKLDGEVPVISQISGAPQSYITSEEDDPSGIPEDGAYRITGSIYLEAGKHYEFSCYMDDAVVMKLNGVELMNHHYDSWGMKYAGGFTPQTDGYYSIDWVVYNGFRIGAFKPFLSVNGGPQLELTSDNFSLQPGSVNSSSSQSSFSSASDVNMSWPDYEYISITFGDGNKPVGNNEYRVGSIYDSYTNLMTTSGTYLTGANFDASSGRNTTTGPHFGNDTLSYLPWISHDMTYDAAYVDAGLVSTYSFTNLPTGKYKLILSASRNVARGDGSRITKYTINKGGVDGGVNTQILDVSNPPSGTTSPYVEFNITPSSGVITFSFEANSGATFGYLGGAVLIKMPNSEQSSSVSSQSSSSVSWPNDEYISMTFGDDNKPVGVNEYRVRGNHDSYTNLLTTSGAYITGVNFDAQLGRNTVTGPHYGNDALSYLPWISHNMTYDAAYVSVGHVGTYSFTNLPDSKYKLILSASRNVGRGDGSRITKYTINRGIVDGVNSQILDASNPLSGATSPYVEFNVMPSAGVITFSFEANSGATFGYLSGAVLIKMSDSEQSSSSSVSGGPWTVSKIDNNLDDVREDTEGLWPNAYDATSGYDNGATAYEGNYLGVWWDIKQYPGLRFNLSAANKTSDQIAEAKLVLYSNGTSYGDPLVRIIAEKNNYCNPWSASHMPTDVINDNRTASFKDYQVLDSLYSDYREGQGHVPYTQLMTIDVTDIIQELASMPGWLGQNGAICITADPLDNGNVHEAGIRDFYHSPAEAAELHIRFVE